MSVKLFVSSIVVIFLSLNILNVNGAGLGGLDERKPADDKVRQLVSDLKTEIFSEICKKSVKGSACPSNDTIVVHDYKQQVVAGTNYFVVIEADDSVWHVRIFESLGKNRKPKLVSVSGPRGINEDISYF